MTNRKVISFSLDAGLISKLRKLGNGNLSEFVNRLLKEAIDAKDLSLVERVENLEGKMDKITKLMQKQGVEL